jgi:hypothetical protein
MLECSGTLWNNLETVEAVLTAPPDLTCLQGKKDNVRVHSI